MLCGPRAAGSDIVTLLGQAESARRTGVPWQVEVKLEAPGERVGQSGRLLSNSTVSTVLRESGVQAALLLGQV